MTVSAAEDDDAANDSATLTHTAAGGDYGMLTGSIAVTTTDNETVGLTLSTTTLGVTEGDDAEYTVRLATEPTATVTVAITGQASTDLTLAPAAASLTFTTATWNTAQTVTVTAGEDDDAANDMETLLHTASGGDYAGETASVAVTVTDDESVGLTMSTATLGVAEGDDAEYTVRLATEPTATVTVAITGQAGTDLGLDSASLTFTTATWNTAQTVTVTAGEDDDAANDMETLLHTASGGDYAGETASVAVTVTDDESVGLTMSTATLGVAEGDDAEYTVRLATEPTATVTVAITGQAGTDLGLDSASLTFTTATWNTAQTVTVSAGEDDDAANDMETLLHTASGGDYAGETASVAVTVTDDETVGLTVSTATLGVNEGDDAEYTVRLATEPTATVTVAITGQAGTDLMLDSASLTFTTATWNTAQTVTVSAGEDDDAANDMETLLHTASGGDYAGETASVAVTVTDDESVGLTMSTATLGVAEGDDAEYTVRLATEPTATVTVAITGQAGTDLGLDSASLTFTTATWNTAQTVTVSAGEDDDAANDMETLLHTASGGDYTGETASVAVTVTDDESVGLTVSTATLGVNEGDDAEYTVRLATEPTATVTVAITGQASTDLTLAPAAASLTFTTATWNTAQTVTVSAGEDDDAANDMETLLHTASGGDYTGETASVAVTVTDDESVGLTVSTATLGVNEGDDAEYTVRLATEPTATVTVAITGQAGTDLMLDSASLTFTTATWNTAQTVTVSAGEDDDAANDMETLLHTASGGDYAGETASVAVTVTDDESVGLTMSTATLGVAEGDDAEYTVRLATEPTATVTVAITGQAGTDLGLDSASLTFTTATWNTAQTVTVTAGEDDDAANDMETLLHTASGGDYAGETASVAVTVTDDETVGLTVSTATLGVNEGDDAEYTVRLATQPTATVTVAITGQAGTDLGLDSASLTFTTATWNTAQTVTVSAGEDDDAANDTETLLHTASGGDYAGETASVAVTVTDDESVGLTMSTATLGVAEGDDAEYTVRLATEPTATVTVAITGQAGTDLGLDSASLTFTTATWNTAQTVTVSAGEDDDAANDMETLLHTASGGDYAGETASVAVTVTDDETVGLTVSTATLGVNEGDDAEYTVRLATEPTATVTVAITGQAGTDLMLDSASLTFTTATWNTAQTVTVSAGEDDDAANDMETLLHTASGGDYAGETASVAVTVTDDESVGLTMSTATLGVAEGDDAEYTVRLATEPTATVTVAITGQAGTDLGLDSASLTFTTSSWNAAQTVTVTAAEDDDAANDMATLLHTASGGDYTGETASVAVTTTDDETVGLTLSTTTLGVTEGDDAEYTVRLATQPTATVTVAITGQAGTDLGLDSTSLTFTTSSWNAAQTVTVTAAEDDDAANDMATLLHTASGGDYTGETASVAVTTTDDETVGLTLSTTTLGVTEGDDAEYTVRLATQPTATVTVAITGQAGTDLGLDSTSLTFTTSSWNAAQTVTVTAAEDDDAANDMATLLHTASGGDYTGETASVAVTTTDDETVGLVLSTSTLGVSEGDDAEYTVRLATEPTATVTVAISGQAGTDLTLDSTSLTFTTATWNAAQTVTVSAAEDDDAANDMATLLHTASGGDYTGETASVSVTTTDDETVGLTLSTSTLGVTEGDDAEYTVRLATQPTATVTVAITGQSGTDLGLASTLLTFTTSTWNTAQTVTVTAGEDDDAVNDTATLLHTASGGGYAGETASVAVTTTDDESVGLVLSTTTLGVAEGDDAEYTVRLATEPTATVTVAITGTSGTDLTLDPASASLTFTTTSWNTARTVTVSAGEDPDADNDAATLVHTASGGDYDSETAEVAVTVTDDELVGLVLSTTTLGVAEGDDAEYTVRLATEPTATVTVAITGTSGTDLTLDPVSASLTFTTTSWNTAQTVTVSAGEDPDADNDAATLVHTASGGDYDSETAEVAVTVTDDESVGLVLSTTTLGVAEGDDAEYTVRLATEPTATVTVAITGTSGTDLTLDPVSASLTFTTTSWNTAQTVTVSAGEDPDADNDAATLVHTASGGDYTGETAEVAVTVTDDESVGLVLSTTTLGVAEGDDAEYTVRLATEPTATVTVAITGTSGTDLTLDPVSASLTFTTTSWNTAQTVTVSAGEDPDADNDAATLVHTASGGDYTGETAEVAVTVTDDESVGLVLSTTTLGVAEGDDAEYTVRLATEPTATVTVAITGTTGTDLTLDTATLTFTTSNWNTAQPVTVEAGEDADADNDTATLVHTASGGGYDSETADLAVTTTDDEMPETAGILLSPTSLTVTEGSEASYTVRLATEPTATVTVAVTGTTGTDLTLDTATLTFTTTNWNTAQPVTVTAEPDDDAEDDEATLTHTATAGGYGSVTADLTVTVDDADGEPVSGELVLSVSPSSVSEGDGTTSVTVTATLSAGARGEATVVTVTVAEDADDYAVTPAVFEIEIPEDATSAAGSFELTPVDDAADEPDQRVAITGTTEVGLAVQGTSVTIRDDDEANRPPTFPETSYTFDLPENVSGHDTAVALGTVAASDADGDRLRYALSAGDGDRFTVSRGGEVSYVGAGEDFESGPSQFDLQVTAGDGEYEAQAQVTVRVVDAPESPEAKDDRAETPEDTPLVIDVLSNDTDPDGERLRVGSVTAPENGTAAVVSGGVRYAPDLNWYGEDRFTYTAMDPGGLTSEATVRVTVTPVNDPPEAVDDEAETLEDVAAVVDVLANDSDVDGDPLTVVSAGPAAHGATAIAGGGVRYSPALNWYGTDRFSYTIADPGGLTATATVTMTVLPVNDAPEAVGVIPDQRLEEGGGAVTVDLTPYFTDVDGDALSYAAVSSDESAVTVAVAGATLTLSPVVTGTGTVTVTASDPDGLTAVQTFGVSVGDGLVREVLTDTLAALGRAHLSSARVAIGQRLEYDDGAMRLMLAGQQLTPDAWEQMGAGGLEQSHWLSLRAAALRQRRSPRDLSGSSADPRFQRSGLMGGGFGGGAGTDWGQMLLSTDVLLSFGGQGETETPGAGVGRWRVWGQGDRQSFQWGADDVAGYEGDLATGYIGVDVQLREHLLAGVAVSRSGGGGEWRQGYSSGRLGAELTVLHPYVRIGGRNTAVWALAGVGRGTAENVRALNGRRGTSPLDLRLGLLEGRHRLVRAAGGVELALRGEASWAELRTGSGEETVDGLAAAVRRLRTGVEATLPLGGPGGMQLAPFGAVSTRHDGGAGQTGLGLETAAGVRVSAGRVRIEAQGRRLLLHTASGYEEHGFSVTAMVGGGHYEPGLTASVRPHWGAPGYGAESLWQDHVQSYAAGPGGPDGGVDARLGYGWRLPGNRLLTPLVGYGRIGDARRMQLGARLGVLGRFSGDLSTPVEVELLGERYGRPEGGADHRVGLYGIVNLGPE